MAKLGFFSNRIQILFFIVILLLIDPLSQSLAAAKSEDKASECSSELSGPCHNKAKALRLNYIAIGTILVASMVGVSLPLFSRAVPALGPDKKLFLLVRAFASGVIVSTGFMHVMPDSWNDLTSPCLPEKPWRIYPLTPFITMLAAYGTMMMDSFSTAYFQRRGEQSMLENGSGNGNGNGNGNANGSGCGHHHGQIAAVLSDKDASRLLKDRVVAQVLEVGIVVHSVVIGLSMGASVNPCTIRPLIAAICFHQLFEGMGLGGCILQAEYGLKVKAIMVFFFSVTTPFGIVLGILLQNVYKENSPTALIVVGVLNAVSAGLLIYMAMVDLLAADFKGPRLQSNMKLQLCCYAFALMGSGLMSLMAVWA